MLEAKKPNDGSLQTLFTLDHFREMIEFDIFLLNLEAPKDMADQIPKSSSNHTIDGALIGLSHVFYLPGTSKCFFIDLLTKSNSASAQKIKRSYTSADKISHTKRLTILARIENLHSSIKNIQANKNTKNFWETHKWYNFHRTLLIYQP